MLVKLDEVAVIPDNTDIYCFEHKAACFCPCAVEPCLALISDRCEPSIVVLYLCNILTGFYASVHVIKWCIAETL